MSKLREQMMMDMDLKGFSDATKTAYISHIEKFTRFFMKAPEKLGEAEIKQYLHHMLTKLNFSQSYNSAAYSALRFIYETTLKRNWDGFKIPRSKKIKKLPVILSREEVKRIFEVTRNIKHRAIFMTIYGAGLRISEAAMLKVVDIDSDRMQIKIQEGKGKKDRVTLLSKTNLNILRNYWSAFHPQKYLFYGADINKPIATRTIQRVFEDAVNRAGITKDVSVHSLRHAFATHLIDAGADVFHIQRLMGHSSIKTTTVYIHISQKDSLKLISPLEITMSDENE